MRVEGQRDFLERRTAQMRMRRFCRKLNGRGLARIAGSYCGKEIMCKVVSEHS